MFVILHNLSVDLYSYKLFILVFQVLVYLYYFLQAQLSSGT